MERVASTQRSTAASERTHIRREVRTALELAIVALAPPKVVEQLATAAGLLEALEELPADGIPVKDLAASIASRAGEALNAWAAWRPKRIPDPV